jgi:ABC-type multidrug transport system fused ATPase/permease subunit
MAKVLTKLTVPMEMYHELFPGSNLEDDMNVYVIWMGGFAVATFLSMFIQKLFFSRLSEQVTYHMRYTLYDSILSKNIGWFDLRENSVGILSASMASDTSLVNGVSSESLGPSVESGFAMLVGMGIGFYYCW